MDSGILSTNFSQIFPGTAPRTESSLSLFFFQIQLNSLVSVSASPPSTRAKGRAALLSCGTSAVVNHVWISLLQVSEALSRSFLPKLLSSHTPGKFLYTLHSPGDAQQPTPFTTLHSPAPKVILWKWTTPLAVEKIIWKISSERILVQENTKKRLESLTEITDHLWEVTLSWRNIHSLGQRDVCISRRRKDSSCCCLGSMGEDLTTHTSGWSEKCLKTYSFPQQASGLAST